MLKGIDCCKKWPEKIIPDQKTLTEKREIHVTCFENKHLIDNKP